MLNSIIIRAIENKKKKGFQLGNLKVDIDYIKKELIELQDASLEERGEELADIIIYCCGIAGYTNIDLEKEVLNKMLKVEARKIKMIDSINYIKKEGIS